MLKLSCEQADCPTMAKASMQDKLVINEKFFVTRSPAVARKSRPCCLRPKFSFPTSNHGEKRFLRCDTFPCTLC